MSEYTVQEVLSNLKTKKSAYNFLRKQIDSYEKMNGIPLKEWSRTEITQFIFDISDTHGYQNTTVMQKVRYMRMLLREENIDTWEVRRHETNAIINEFCNQRLDRFSRKSTRADYISYKDRRAIAVELWTRKPYRDKDANAHYGALLFLVCSMSTGPRAGDFAHCRWSDITIEWCPEIQAKILMFRPIRSKVPYF